MNEEEKHVLEFAEFVSTKFAKNREGWIYSRDLGGLKHIRYESDYTGYNHWTKRVRRALNLKRILGLDRLSRQLGVSRKREGLSARFWSAYWHVVINLRKDSNLPDGQINGIITIWEEDGQYIMFFGPTTGVKVLDFIREDPDNPHAKAILAEMVRNYNRSYPQGDEDELG